MEDLQHAVQALQRPAAPQFLPRSGAGKERGSTAVSKAETGACLPVEVNELQQAPADQETMELSAAAKKAEEAEKEAEEVQRRELMESQLGRIALAVCASIRRFVNCKDIFDYYASEPYAGRVDSGARLHSSWTHHKEACVYTREAKSTWAAVWADWHPHNESPDGVKTKGWSDAKCVLVWHAFLQVGAPLLVPLIHHVNAGDDNEDRKRLKEKLKARKLCHLKRACRFQIFKRGTASEDRCCLNLEPTQWRYLLTESVPFPSCPFSFQSHKFPSQSSLSSWCDATFVCWHKFLLTQLCPLLISCPQPTCPPIREVRSQILVPK